MASDRKKIIGRIKTTDKTDPEMEKAFLEARREKIEIDGRESFFELRKLWSICIIVWISAFILFHIGITISVGMGGMNFQQHQWLIPLIVIENFLQIVGMGYIVVKFFYTPHGK